MPPAAARLVALLGWGNAEMVDGVDDLRLRRDAMQIALQLPTDKAEALQVLKYAEELVRGFLAAHAEPQPPERPPLRLV